jgi:AcrR family transcriptional regulator
MGAKEVREGAERRDAAEGAEPKRLRGHLRVAAILRTASALFAEQGYDAVTMTEIAARSNTAIGSLYRFFPTKEFLADALLKRYGERIDAELSALAQKAGSVPLDALADALVDHALAWAPDRAAALVLIEARAIVGAQRQKIRDQMRRRVGEIVAKVNPALPKAEAETKAAILRQLLKMTAANADDEAPVEEMRELVRLYLKGRVAGA